MKGKRTGCFFAAVLLLAGTGGISAQNNDKKLAPRVEPLPSATYLPAPETCWQGDSLSLTFTAEVTGKLKGIRALRLKPEYISRQDTVRFPDLVFATRKWRNFNRRRMALEHTGQDAEVVIVKKYPTMDFDYNQALLVPSSPEGKVVIRQYYETCCDQLPIRDTWVGVSQKPYTGRIGRDTIYITLPQQYAAGLSPSEGKREASVNVVINYESGRYDVIRNFADNARELAKIDSVLVPILQDRDRYEIQSLCIIGHTSPEDTYEYNRQLANYRGRAMADYVRKNYPMMRDVDIIIHGSGEDWDGLRKMVDGCGQPWEREVLHIIDTVGTFDGREKQLMDLRGGQPYRYMMEHFFPSLRRMEMRLQYKEK